MSMLHYFIFCFLFFVLQQTKVVPFFLYFNIFITPFQHISPFFCVIIHLNKRSIVAVRAILIENRFRLENRLLLFEQSKIGPYSSARTNISPFFRTCIFESLSVFSIFGSKTVLDENGPQKGTLS